jgi:hypothetical protein
MQICRYLGFKQKAHSSVYSKAGQSKNDLTASCPAGTLQHPKITLALVFAN